MSWIDDERERRSRGEKHALLPSQHNAINARYPGCTLEYCWACGNPTDRAGAEEDSLFTAEGIGPYCEECWDALSEAEREE